MPLKDLVITKQLLCLEYEPGKHRWAYVWFDRDHTPVRIRWLED